MYPQTMGEKWDNGGGSGDDYAWKSSARMTTVQQIMLAWHGARALVKTDDDEVSAVAVALPRSSGDSRQP